MGGAVLPPFLASATFDAGAGAGAAGGAGALGALGAAAPYVAIPAAAAAYAFSPTVRGYVNGGLKSIIDPFSSPEGLGKLYNPIGSLFGQGQQQQKQQQQQNVLRSLLQRGSGGNYAIPNPSVPVTPNFQAPPPIQAQTPDASPSVPFRNPYGGF